MLRGSNYAAFTNTLFQSRKVHENLTCTQPARQLFNAFLQHTPADHAAPRAASSSGAPRWRLVATPSAPISAPPGAAKKTAASKRANCRLGVSNRAKSGAVRRVHHGARRDAAHATSFSTLLCFQIRRDYETRGRYWQADCRSGARGRRMDTGARRCRRKKSRRRGGDDSAPPTCGALKNTGIKAPTMHANHTGEEPGSDPRV